MFPVEAYQLKNETVYYDISQLQMHIIQGPFQHLRLPQRATSYVRRVLYRPLSEIPFMRNLMQGSIRDFSISIVKNIPQNKTTIAVCCKKRAKPRTIS